MIAGQANDQCRICSTAGTNAPQPQDPSCQIREIQCPRCGTFRIELSAWTLSGGFTATQIGNASGWIREHEGVEFPDFDSLDRLRTLPTPSVGEKADKLLLFLAKNWPRAGAHIDEVPIAGHYLSSLPDKIRPLIDRAMLRNGSPTNCFFDHNPQSFRWMAACWAETFEEVQYIIYEYLLKHKCFLNVSENGIEISPEGWNYLHSLRQINQASQIGFCAMWFNPQVDAIWEKAIEPAIEAAGYQPVIMLKHEHNNRIDDEIIAMIRRSRFVVADFTHGEDGARGGVYFEAGFALGLGLEIIHTCRQDMIDEKKIHFDNRQYNFITWTESNLAEFQRRLQFRIEGTLGKGGYDRAG